MGNTLGNIGTVTGTAESGEANLILGGGGATELVTGARRGIIDQWTSDHHEVIIAVLDRLALIATKGKSDRDAIAAGKVLLDHSLGRPPEAVESKPNQTLIIVRSDSVDDELLRAATT